MIKIASPKPFSGTVESVVSKSSLHRLLIAAAAAHFKSSDDEQNDTFIIRTANKKANFFDDFGEDIAATVRCLVALGFEITLQDGDFFVKNSKVDLSQKMTVKLDAGESGSTLRFLIPFAAAILNKKSTTPKCVTFVGKGRLPNRPVIELAECIAENGTIFIKQAAASLPISLYGTLKSGVFKINGDTSSQYISGLLFALILLDDASEIILTSSLESKMYVKMTIDALKKIGVNIFEQTNSENTTDVFIVIPSKLKMGNLEAENDWSSAAFFLAAGALPESNGIIAKGLSLESVQPDKAILDILTLFGANVIVKDGVISVSPSKDRKLKPVNFDFSDCPDIFPICSVLAAVADGKSVFTGTSRLAIKESDRVNAMSDVLRKISQDNVVIKDEVDFVTITGTGKRFNGGTVESFNDHRIAMSAGIAATFSDEPVVINGAEAVAKSFPSFWSVFSKGQQN